MSHATRYNTLEGLGGKEKYNAEYCAAFYLLSSDKELFEVACNFIDRGGIDFGGIKKSTKGFDESTRHAVDVAHNLFSYDSPCKATPFEISRLGFPLMQQVCSAISIAAGKTKVIVRADENDKLTLELDSPSAAKAKGDYNFFKEKMLESPAKPKKPEAHTR